MVDVDLARMPLFEGLDEAALADICSRMQPRRFKARSFICRQGEPGNSLFVIQRGLAQVFIEPSEEAIPKPRLRRGDIIGEVSLLTGGPRSASVRASVTSDVLELSQEAFAAIVARYPTILVNLSRILSRRLAHPNVAQPQSRRRGEAVALVVGQRGAPLVAEVIEATRAASPKSIIALDLTASLPAQDLPLELRELRGDRGADGGGEEGGQRRRESPGSVEDVLNVLDNVLSAHATAIVLVDTSQDNLALLLEHVDRTVVLGSEAEVRRPAAIVGPTDTSAHVVLLTEHPQQAPRTLGGLRVLRAFNPDHPGARAHGGRDIAWLGRHLSRTKLGLALGAGGAKGYAHVGALQVLQDAGYTVDYVAGSSIGAVIGAWLALGMDASAIEATMRRTFAPDTVEVMFRPSMAGRSAGWEVMARLWRETTDNQSFADLAIPFVAMAVNLDTGLPAPITEGPLWQALLASTAIPGLFAPYEHGKQRLVDGVALVPVPTGSVIEAGADIIVSINVMRREKLAAWPGESPPDFQPAEQNNRALDALMDVMELTWRDSSTRHAALADVVITPRFGPGGWRAFHLADRFIAAGREAAEKQLAALGTLARPQVPSRHQTCLAGSSKIIVTDGHKDGFTHPAVGAQAPQEITLEDLKDVLINLIGLPAHEVPDDPSRSFQGLGLDSIAMLEVQVELEQRYGFRIPEAHAQQIRTMGDAIKYVNDRLAER